MKNKERIYTLITLLGVVATVTTLGFATDGFTHLTNAEGFLLRLKSNNRNNWTITKSDLDVDQDTFAKLTSNNNPIVFNKSKTSISNVDPITGLSSVSFESSNSYVLISTGYNSDESLYERYIKNDGSNEFNVSLVGECFLTISSLEEESLDVDNIDISYSCSQSQQEYFDSRLAFTYNSKTESYSVGKKTGFGSGDTNTVCLIPMYFDDGVNGKHPVTEIIKSGFNACYFTTVYLPSSITTLNNNSFNQCWYLNNVYIADSVTSIGSYSFSKCQRLTSIRLSERVTTFGMDVFDGCSILESIHLPDSLTTIGSSTFVSCQKLKEVNCPRGISKLPTSTFYYCHALEEFTITSNVTSLGDSVFRNCNNISTVNYEGTVAQFTTSAMGKRSDWFSACPLLKQVNCTDGVVTYE